MKTFIITLVAIGLFFSASLSHAESDQGKIVDVSVTKKGFEPKAIEVKPGVPLTLRVTRKTDATCAKAITVAGTDIKKELPLNETVEVEVGPLKEGEIKFGCGMGRMVGGVIVAK